MQHVIEQRHLVGAGRLVGDLHLEQGGAVARTAVVDHRRQHVADNAVGHRLQADRNPGLPVERAANEKPLAPAPSGPTLPPRTALNVASLLAGPSRSPRLASRSPMMLAGLPPATPSSSTAADATAARRAVGVNHLEGDRGRRRVAVAVGHRIGRRDRRNRARRRSVGRERVLARRLHLEQAGANVDRLRVAVTPKHQRRAVDVRHRRAIGAWRKVQLPGDRRAFRDVLRSLGRRRRRIVVEGDGQRAVGRRAVGVGDRVGQPAVVGRLVSSFGPPACSTLSSSVTL